MGINLIIIYYNFGLDHYQLNKNKKKEDSTTTEYNFRFVYFMPKIHMKSARSPLNHTTNAPRVKSKALFVK